MRTSLGFKEEKKKRREGLRRSSEKVRDEV